MSLWRKWQELDKDELLRVILLIIAYIVLFVLIGAAFIDYRQKTEDRRFEEKQKEDAYKRYKENGYEGGPEEFEKEYETFLEEIKEDPSHDFLSEVETIGQEHQSGTDIYYYDARDIKELGVECDTYHMNWFKTDFEECFHLTMNEPVTTMDDFDKRNRMKVYTRGDKYTIFETVYTELTDDVNYTLKVDTASERIHEINMWSADIDALSNALALWVYQYGDGQDMEETSKHLVIQLTQLADEDWHYECMDPFLLAYQKFYDKYHIRVMPIEKKAIFKEVAE